MAIAEAMTNNSTAGKGQRTAYCKKKHRFLPFSSFYSDKSITFASTYALVAKLVDALDLGSSGSDRVGSSPIRRTKEIPSYLTFRSWGFFFFVFGNAFTLPSRRLPSSRLPWDGRRAAFRSPVSSPPRQGLPPPRQTPYTGRQGKACRLPLCTPSSALR